MSVEEVLRAVRRSSGRSDEDWSDVLSKSVTSNLLVAAAGVVSFKLFADKPIDCTLPSFFPNSWIAVKEAHITDLQSTSYLMNVILQVAQAILGPTGGDHSTEYKTDVLTAKLECARTWRPRCTIELIPIQTLTTSTVLFASRNIAPNSYRSTMMIESFISMVRYLSPRHDDDWCDRLHYLVTPNILFAFSVLISFKQFGGRPIECMFPNKFPSSWEQYAENYCWSQDTYFVEPQQHVELLKHDQRYTPERQLSYYQWVPFFLLLQAAFFRAPSFLWRAFSNHSGIRMHEVVEKAKDTSNVEEEVRQRNIHILARHLQNALRFRRRMEKKKVVVHKTVTCLNYQYSSGFVSAVYLFTKGLYLLNVVLQLWLMNTFLGTNRHQWYGLGVIRDIISGVVWERSGYFPRSAICDFEVRQVANIQKYSVQCVLVINIFNEKIFVILWFWYLMLFVAAAFTFVSWFILLLFPCFSRWFVEQHLDLSNLERYDSDAPQSSSNIHKFVYDYLRRDGIFVLRMVSSHAGIIFGTDLIVELWKTFYGIEKTTAPPLVPNGEDPLQTELKNATAMRNRKKQNMLSYIEGSDVQTALMPLTPDTEEKKSCSSDDERRQ